MARKKGLKLRTWVLLGIVLLLLGSLGAGFYWVYDRGLKREGLFDRAARAYREGRVDDALALARETLRSEPNHPHARDLVLETLVALERYDEAKAEARAYLDEDPERHYAAIRLCQLALREGDGETAERLAYTFADRDPAYAYQILARVRDHRGLVCDDWRLRLAAAATMRGLASFAENDGVRAEALIYSAEVSYEVASGLPKSELILQRVQADLRDAVSAATAAAQANKTYPYEVAMGRIRVLAADPAEAALGAQMLRSYTSGAMKRDVAVAALARYHIVRGEWKDAIDIARNLEDLYLWHRIYWMVRRSDGPDQALPLLESGPLPDAPEGAMLRAELLVRSDDPARRDEGLKSLRAMAEDPASPSPVVLRALILIAAASGADAAVAVADRAGLEERKDPRITALLASLLSVEGSARGLELAERLAQETDGLSASRDLMRLLGGGAEALDRYMETQVSKGGPGEVRHRLYRSLALLARAAARKGGPESAQEVRQRVRSDLEALRASAEVAKPDLVAGFQLAASLGEAELAGALLGRAFSLPGAPDLLDARVLAFARELKERDTLALLAAGIRSAAAGSPARAFLEVFADIVAAPDGIDARTVARRLEEAAGETGSRVLALELASRIAFGEGDLVEAERLGRGVLAEDPRNPGALEIVGAALLRRGAADEVLGLYGALPRPEWPEAGYRETVRALLDRGRKEEALATAREALRRFPASATSHLLLAQLYRDLKEPRRALSVLHLAPPHPLVVHMRAELLRETGDLAMAERLYEILLASVRFADLRAWQGLMETLSQLKRTKDFVVFCERALAGGHLSGQPEVATMVRYMRGMCLELDGKIGEALADYEEAIRLDGTNWGALNNAAWHIARTAPTRIADARAYIDRARELRPEDPVILDTAAEVHSAQGDIEGALGLVDRALALAPESKAASYAVHKAEILLRGEREEEARALLEAVRAKHPDSPASERARSLLWEMDHRHLPEEPVLPDAPEDREESGKEGGGE